MFQAFPILLLRIGGLPLSILEDMNWKSNWPKDIQQLENAKAKATNQLLQSLENAIQEQDQIFDKRFLQFFQKTIKTGQWPASGKILRLTQFEGTEQLKQDLQILIKARDQLSLFHENFTHAHQQFLEEQFKQLYQEANQEDLLKGMSLSSHSLFQRLLDLKKKPAHSFRKKEKQTLRSLWTYLSRIVYKVSPFSTFTQLAIYDAFQSNRLERADLPKASNVQLNHTLFAYLQELLAHYPPFYQHLSLRLNSSLELGASYRFLLNSRNVESLQTLEKDPVVDLIIAVLNGQQSALSFLSLLEQMSKAIDAPSDLLVAYLYQLVQLGLLEWHWPVSGMNPFWADQLLDFLPKTSDDDLLTDLSNLLKRLMWGRSLLGQVPSIQRVNIQKECCKQVKLFWEHYQHHLPETEKEWKEGEAFQRISSRAFVFKPENLFFEDCRHSTKIDLNHSDLFKQCQLLDDLLQLLAPLQEDQLSFDLTTLYQKQFAAAPALSLLQFYQAYQQFEASIDYQAYRQKFEQVRKLWKMELTTFLSKQDNCVNLNLADLKRIAALHPAEQTDKTDLPLALGCLLKVWGKAEQPQVFVDTCFPGYGKMLGRFLPLFDEDCTRQIRDWNKSMQEGDLFVEISDASYFNANVHPPLLAYEMRMPGSQNNLPEAQQIALDDLIIQLDEKEQRLQLFHQASQKQVFIFDFGFEALANRSPLYRFLAHFSKPTENFSVLCELINEIEQPDTSANIIRHPRIKLGTNLCLQRQRWYFHLDEIPYLEKGETEAAYFLRLHLWRTKQELPQQMFYSLNPKEIDLSAVEEGDKAKAKKEDYKPQFLDFNHPLSVQLFSRVLERVPLYLKMEEMLPSPADWLSFDGEKRVCEFVVQWERGREH